MGSRYTSIDVALGVDRRRFVRGLGACSAVAGGVVLGRPGLFAEEATKTPTPAPAAVETNIKEFLAAPRTRGALPGPFPGRVVEVSSERCLAEDGAVDGTVVRTMVERGITRLTGKSLEESFGLLFSRDDVVGLKVNPVGPPLINTRLELVEAVIGWLTANGLPRSRIVVWDRFDSMLADAGFTPTRFPGVRIEGLQTMDEEGDAWRDAGGRHVSRSRFDLEAYYLAKGVVGRDVRGYPSDEAYLNQHVFNGERSYFGKLVSRELTKIVNLPVFKNTGNGVSMATKNLGYGAICNTGRLHAPLFFNVCTEVLAAPWIRNKLALTITDGLRGQYDGGPMLNAQFVYPHRTLYFATDPFAADMVGHRELVAKRKAEGVKVNEHPRYTEYLRYAERLGLGVTDPGRIERLRLAL